MSGFNLELRRDSSKPYALKVKECSLCLQLVVIAWCLPKQATTMHLINYFQKTECNNKFQPPLTQIPLVLAFFSCLDMPCFPKRLIMILCLWWKTKVTAMFPYLLQKETSSYIVLFRYSHLSKICVFIYESLNFFLKFLVHEKEKLSLSPSLQVRFCDLHGTCWLLWGYHSLSRNRAQLQAPFCSPPIWHTHPKPAEGVSLSPLNWRWMAASRLSHSRSWACARRCASSGLRVSHSSRRTSRCRPARSRLPSTDRHAWGKTHVSEVLLKLPPVKYFPPASN